MQPLAELDRLAPEFRAVTAAGPEELSQYRGQWLALVYCPRESCQHRSACLEDLRNEERQISALGGRLLMIHPPLDARDKGLEDNFLLHNLDAAPVGTLTDPGFIKSYQVAPEDGQGHGITGVFLIDPQGKLRAAARYMACQPAVVREVAALMRTAVDRFGASGTRDVATSDDSPATRDPGYGCVAWYMYQ